MNKKLFPNLLFFLFFLILGIKISNLESQSVIIILTLAFIFILVLSKLNIKIIAINIIFLVLGILSKKHQEQDFNNLYKKIPKQVISIAAQIIEIENLKGNYQQKINLKILQCIKKELIGKKLLIFLTRPTFIKKNDLISTNIEIKKNNNEDFKNYLIREGFLGCIFSNRFFYKKLNSIEKTINKQKKIFSNTNTDIMYNSIFIGERDKHNYYYQKINDHFNFWGTGHILARSGLHLVVLIFLLNLILKLLYLPLRIRKLISVIITFIFFLKTTIALPFARAFWMYILKEINFIFSNNTSILNIFCATTIFTLAKNPILLNFLDFQLSFGITFILILWAHLKKLKQSQIIDFKN